MPLIALWRGAPDAVGQMTIEQIVSNAGDGLLRDNSNASEELRSYLSQVPAIKLREYAEYCLANSFAKGGYVLQDLVNELGRRLEYRVENGRYQGTVSHIGFDGLWTSPEGNGLVVEVKTTDAYRINLDGVAAYRTALIEAGKAPRDSSILIVVGRIDTGDLEAQIRGSRHAWDIRVLSVDSLVKLVRLKETVEEEETSRKIRSLLVPFEYTRLDNIIEVVFTAAQDVESGDKAAPPDIESEVESKAERDAASHSRTAPEIINEIRKRAIDAVASREGTALIAKSRAQYWSADHTMRVVCSVSKRHSGSAPYWFAYHPSWDEFLASGDRGFFVLACADQNVAYAIPRRVMADNLASLNQTIRDDGVEYWHVKLVEPHGIGCALALPSAGMNLPLNEYALQI